MIELIQKLISGTGVNQEQAEGGAGLLFQLAKDTLSSGDFSQITDAIPGVDSLVKKAPSNDSGGLGGLIGGLATALGGEGFGNIAELATGFSKLGLDPDMVAKFAPIVINFVQEKGGDTIADLLKGVLDR